MKNPTTKISGTKTPLQAVPFLRYYQLCAHVHWQPRGECDLQISACLI